MRGLIFLILIGSVYLLVRGMAKSARGSVRGRSPKKGAANPNTADASELVQDPECGTYVPIDQAFRLSVKGKERYFCSEDCADDYRDRMG